MGIRTQLMKHQKLIVDFCKDKKYAAIFADYGTGKTLCALSLVNKTEKIRKILVVSSKTAVMSTWPQEIKIHSTFRYVHLLGNKRQKIEALKIGLRKSLTPSTPYSEERHQPVFFLINFDGVRTIYNELYISNFDYIIVDESTKIKSPKTKRSKVMWALGRSAKRRIIMTGFPITENLSEIYSQIKFLDFGEAFGGNYYAFLDRYFYRAGFKRKLKRGSEKKIFKLIKDFSIRVTNDVLDLPPQVYEKKIIEPTPEQIKLLDELKTYFQLEFGKVKIDTQYIFALINKSLQICDGFVQDNRGNREMIPTNKDEAILDLVEDIDPIKNKVLVWAVFRFSVRKLQKLFQKQYKKSIKIVTLTGDTENVDGVIKQFQHSKDTNILIATQKKASESITLTACRHAIYYSNNWSYDLRANSEARIRRKGSEKHKSIIYTDLIMDGSIDQMVYDCLKRKKDLVTSLKAEFKKITISSRR